MRICRAIAVTWAFRVYNIAKFLCYVPLLLAAGCTFPVAEPGDQARFELAIEAGSAVVSIGLAEGASELSLQVADSHAFEVTLSGGDSVLPRRLRIYLDVSGPCSGMICVESAEGPLQDNFPLMDVELFTRGPITMRFDPPFLRIRRGAQELSASRVGMSLPSGIVDLAWRGVSMLRVDRVEPSRSNVQVSTGGFRHAPGSGAFPRRLNNFVTLLAERGDRKLTQSANLNFELKRDGWVHFSAKSPHGPIDLALTGRSANGGSAATRFVLQPNAAGWAETLVRLSSGHHVATVTATVPSSIGDVRIRQVSEMLLARTDGRPMSTSPEQWSAILETSVVPHFTTLVVGGIESKEDLQPLLKVRQQRRLLLGTGVPGGWMGTWDANAMAQEWKGLIERSTLPLDGLIIDECTAGNAQKWDDILGGLQRLRREAPGAATKACYFYVAGAFDLNRANVKSVEEHMATVDPSAVVWEAYLGEPRSAKEGEALLAEMISGRVARLRRNAPDLASRTIMLVGIFSRAPASLDSNSEFDFRVWLDRQMYLLATDPACAGLSGFGFWASHYADPSLVAWVGELARHYGIDGKRTLLSAEKGLEFALGFLHNGNFRAGLEHWTVNAGGLDEARLETELGSGAAIGVFPKSFTWDTGVRLLHQGPGVVELQQSLRKVNARRIYRIRAVWQVPNNQRWKEDGEIELVLEGGAILQRRMSSHAAGRLFGGQRGFRAVEMAATFQAGDGPATLILRSTGRGAWTPKVVMVEIVPEPYL